MTTQGEQIAEIWKDPGFAREWEAHDSFNDFLVLPRRLSSALIAQERPQARVVLDVASGPGAFLAEFLDQLPEARGIWTDASEAMLDAAHERLAGYGDRVQFVVADMTDLASAGLPHDIDVVATSRAAHHLDRAGLHAFYAETTDRLTPGGWLVNLDHIGPPDVWDRRLRTLRKKFVAESDGPKHHHNYPLTSIQDHLDAFHAAGIDDVEVAWRAFYTALFVGRKDG